MLDHVFLTVGDSDRSLRFYEKGLPNLGNCNWPAYDGRHGPAGHRDPKGLGAKARIIFRLQQGTAAPAAVHVGFVANSEAMVDIADADADADAEALAAGATEIPHGPQLDFDPRYYAGQLRGLDGYSVEVVYKSRQHAS